MLWASSNSKLDMQISIIKLSNVHYVFRRVHMHPERATWGHSAKHLPKFLRQVLESFDTRNLIWSNYLYDLLSFSSAKLPSTNSLSHALSDEDICPSLFVIIPSKSNKYRTLSRAAFSYFGSVEVLSSKVKWKNWWKIPELWSDRN